MSKTAWMSKTAYNWLGRQHNRMDDAAILYAPVKGRERATLPKCRRALCHRRVRMGSVYCGGLCRKMDLGIGRYNPKWMVGI